MFDGAENEEMERTLSRKLEMAMADGHGFHGASGLRRVFGHCGLRPRSEPISTNPTAYMNENGIIFSEMIGNKPF